MSQTVGVPTKGGGVQRQWGHVPMSIQVMAQEQSPRIPLFLWDSGYWEQPPSTNLLGGADLKASSQSINEK